MVRDSAMLTTKSPRVETTITLSNGTIADPLRPPFPKMRDESQMHRARPTSRRVLPPGEYDRRCRITLPERISQNLANDNSLAAHVVCLRVRSIVQCPLAARSHSDVINVVGVDRRVR